MKQKSLEKKLKESLRNNDNAQLMIYKTVIKYLDQSDYTNLRQFCNNYIKHLQ